MPIPHATAVDAPVPLRVDGADPLAHIHQFTAEYSLISVSLAGLRRPPSRLSPEQSTRRQTLAKTLQQWSGPIAAMWRCSKNNGITEGFHRKMKLIQRRAYGFRNFNNYRLRVIAHCG